MKGTRFSRATKRCSRCRCAAASSWPGSRSPRTSSSSTERSAITRLRRHSAGSPTEPPTTAHPSIPSSPDMGPVLVVAPADDLHAASLAAVLERDFDVPAIIWDRASVPAECRLDFRVDARGDHSRLVTPSASYAFEDFHAVWWRRPEPPRIDGRVTDPRVRRFCEAESDALLKGALRSLRVPIG